MFSPNQHAVNGSVPAVRLPTYRSRHGPSAQSRCFPGRWRATTNCSSYAARIHVPSLTLMMRSARSSHSIASVTAAPNTRPAWQQRSPPTGHNGPRRPWKRPRREEVCTWIPIELFADEHKLILHARICILRCPQLRIAVSVEACTVLTVLVCPKVRGQVRSVEGRGSIHTSNRMQGMREARREAS
jgi:hypothetical protein